MSTPVVRPTAKQTEQLDAADDFRLRCAELFDLLPEPPVYRRADEPARARLAELPPRIEALMNEAGRVKSSEPGIAESRRLADALAAMGETIRWVSEDQLANAEEAWLKFLRLKEQALSSRKIWYAPEEVSSAVFDRTTGASRFDAMEHAESSIQLVCPKRRCGNAESYSATLMAGRREFRCSRCGETFVAYLAEVRDVKVDAKSRSKTRYSFRLGESSGAQTKVHFEDGTSSLLRVARGDYLALIYAVRDLRAALNLNTGRVLWVKRPGACFVVSAVFGAEAAELEAFRAFRDGYLETRWQGRLLIRAYYFVGPMMVELINVFGLTAPARRALRRLHVVLQNRGYSRW